MFVLHDSCGCGVDTQNHFYQATQEFVAKSCFAGIRPELIQVRHEPPCRLRAKLQPSWSPFKDNLLDGVGLGGHKPPDF